MGFIWDLYGILPSGNIRQSMIYYGLSIYGSYINQQILPGLVNMNKKRTGKIQHAINMGKSTIKTGPFSIAM
jgi:hypothetical protein